MKTKRIKLAGLWFLTSLAALFAGKWITFLVIYLDFKPWGEYILLGVAVVALADVAWRLSGTDDEAPVRVQPVGSAHVWVVEMMRGNATWSPTVGCRLNKADGRMALADRKRRNPHDRFRLMRYAPQLLQVSVG